MSDKKKIAAMLVMGLKPKKPMGGVMPSDKGMPPKMGADSDPEDMKDGGSDEDTESEPSDHEAAAQEVLDAIKSNDVSGFAEAMKSFVKMCDYSDDAPTDSGNGEM